MTAQHTPGKLIFGIRGWTDDHSAFKVVQKPFDYTGPGYYDNPGLYAEDGTEVVGCGEYSIFSSGEDARRLVACWNACQGITTERLEDLGRPLMQHLIGCDERAARMVKERDELLAALKAAVECGMVPNTSASEGGASKHSRQVQVADMIRAAIQKATNKEQA